MYHCKAPLSRFYYAETRRIINDFIIIIIISNCMTTVCICHMCRRVVALILNDCSSEAINKTTYTVENTETQRVNV